MISMGPDGEAAGDVRLAVQPGAGDPLPSSRRHDVLRRPETLEHGADGDLVGGAGLCQRGLDVLADLAHQLGRRSTGEGSRDGVQPDQVVLHRGSVGIGISFGSGASEQGVYRGPEPPPVGDERVQCQASVWRDPVIAAGRPRR